MSIRNFSLSLTVCALLLTGCQSAESRHPRKLNIWDTATHILKALDGKNMEKLSHYVHPEKGVRFTPFTYVQPEEDIVLSAEEVRTAFEDDTIRNWGMSDAGEEEDMRLPFSQYYLDYLWDQNYLEAKKVAWNERMMHGSMIDNAREAYPDAQIVEYHFPGFEEQYGGLDWVSLRLILEQHEKRWYLVGIIHDRWSP